MTANAKAFDDDRTVGSGELVGWVEADRSGGSAATAPTKVGRNVPCPCGSDRRFKHGCGAKDCQRRISCRNGPWAPAIGRPEAKAAGVVPCSDEAKRRRKVGRRDFVVSGNRARFEQFSGALQSRRHIYALRPAGRGGGQPAAGGGTAARLLQCAQPSRPPPRARGGEPEALLADRRLSRTADDPLERRRYSAKALAMEGKLEEAEKELRSLLSLSRQSWLRQEFFLGGCCRTARCSRRLRIT